MIKAYGDFLLAMDFLYEKNLFSNFHEEKKNSSFPMINNFSILMK